MRSPATKIASYACRMFEDVREYMIQRQTMLQVRHIDISFMEFPAALMHYCSLIASVCRHAQRDPDKDATSPLDPARL